VPKIPGKKNREGEWRGAHAKRVQQRRPTQTFKRSVRHDNELRKGEHGEGGNSAAAGLKSRVLRLEAAYRK